MADDKFTSEELEMKFPPASSLEHGVDNDDNYDVFGDAEWLKASSRLKEELGPGKEMKNASQWKVDPEVERDAGSDNFDGSLDDIKIEQFDTNSEMSSFLMEQALEMDDSTFYDDGSDFAQDQIDEEDQYEDYDSEDYEADESDFDEENEEDAEELDFFS